MTNRRNGFGQPVGAAVEGWTARPAPSRLTMDGRYCRLEPLHAERHAATLHDSWSRAPDDRDWTYLFDDRPADLAACRTHVNRLAATSDPLHFAIVDLPSARAVGSAALMRIDPVHGAIEVGGITYSPELMRTRAGTEAMYLLMRYAFDELGYRRYEWKCDALNAPSRSAAVRYGFQFEGVFRQAVVYKGRSRDTAWYSIISTDWPDVRAAFETWLSPENFDDAGVQRFALAELRTSTPRSSD